MHRRPLLDALSRYKNTFPEEAAIAKRIADLVEKHADCFDRSCRPGHITGSAWVLSADRRRCLLLHHAKLDKWVQPGGHADGDPDVAAVALRETQEESGIEHLTLLGGSADVPFDLDVHRIPARYDAEGRLIEDAHDHHDIRWLLAAVNDVPLVVSHESRDVRWLLPNEVRQYTDEESVLRLLRKSLPFMAA